MIKTDVTAVLGISGVGKTSAIIRLRNQYPLLHLQASDLLKAAYSRKGAPQSSEQLRLGAVKSNQMVLIDEFRTAVQHAALPVVFDGHAVIEGANGVEYLDWEIFKAIGVNRLVFLRSTPQKIELQRSFDLGRKRPEASFEVLKELQETALAHAEQIASKLGVPFHVILQDDLIGLANAIFPNNRNSPGA